MTCKRDPFLAWEAEANGLESIGGTAATGTVKAVIEKPPAPLWIIAGVQWVPADVASASPDFASNTLDIYGAVKVGGTLRRLGSDPINNGGAGGLVVPTAWEGATALDGLQLELSYNTTAYGALLGNLKFFAKAWPSVYMPPDEWERLKSQCRLMNLTPPVRTDGVIP